MRYRRFAPSSRRSPFPGRGRLRSGCRLAFLVIVAGGGLSGARPAWGGPESRAIAIDAVRTIPRYPLDVIADYERALATTVSVLERELGFPRLSGTLLLFPDKHSLRDSLLQEGHSRRVSGDAADALAAVASSTAVRINQRAMLPLRWPERVQVIAHELTHIAQNQLAGGRRGASQQWLREGLAVWVSLRVLEVLGHGRLAVALRDARDVVGHEGRKGWRPTLAELSTFEGWARASADRPAKLLYDQALLATDALITSRGLAAALHYFSRFQECNDQHVNFRAAFEEEGTSFEKRFDVKVTELIRDYNE